MNVKVHDPFLLNTPFDTFKFQVSISMEQMVQNYEEIHFPLPAADPIDVIQYYIEQRGLKYKDLIGMIGDKTLVSKVINRERKLNLRMVKNLHDRMKIPYALLLQD